MSRSPKKSVGLVSRDWWINPRSKMDESRLGAKLRIMSYNILAPSNVQLHLYRHATEADLSSKNRHRRLVQEIGTYQPDIACFQEVDDGDHDAHPRNPHQIAHPDEMTIQELSRDLFQQGYVKNPLFKKRTGSDQFDGCAMFWREDLFELKWHRHLEYFRDGTCLDKHNVGLVGLFKTKSTGQIFCIATTHLLYNPRRGWVKLGQLQDLFHGIADCLNFGASTFQLAKSSIPVFTMGDFNFLRQSPLFEYMIRGDMSFKPLVDERALAGYFVARPSPDPKERAKKHIEEAFFEPTESAYPSLFKPFEGATTPPPYTIRHPFVFQSAYTGLDPETGHAEVSTHHSGVHPPESERIAAAQKGRKAAKNGVTVDYILYGGLRDPTGQEPPERVVVNKILRLPTIYTSLSCPNLNAPSDHVPLVVDFQLLHP